LHRATEKFRWEKKRSRRKHNKQTNNQTPTTASSTVRFAPSRNAWII
jgi:hypothetical protein